MNQLNCLNQETYPAETVLDTGMVSLSCGLRLLEGGRSVDLLVFRPPPPPSPPPAPAAPRLSPSGCCCWRSAPTLTALLLRSEPESRQKRRVG